MLPSNISWHISFFWTPFAISTFKNCVTVTPFLLQSILISSLNMKMNKQPRLIKEPEMVKGLLFELDKLYNTKFGQLIECVLFFTPNKMQGSKSKW